MMRSSRNSRDVMFESGQVLQDRYQLQHPLGRSPQGRQTWLATDSTTNFSERVILKLLVFSEMQWQDLKLFEREAQVLKSLDHPRIPRYRDYFFIEQQSHSSLCWWGLVQDYVPGRSLQDLLDQRTRWSEQEVRQIAENVLQILNYLHGLSPPVLHRDIKPSNLILDQTQQVWLVDFGAVQDQAVATGVSFTVVGTVGYAPLEQFWGRPVASSDLYALGATLIHLLTGVAPVDLPQRNLRIHFRDRISTYSSFIHWVEKLSEPALEKRFSSTDEAREALETEMYSEITPISNRIQAVCSRSTRYHGIRPRVLKLASPQMLEIKVRETPQRTETRALLFLFYVVWGFLTCVLLAFFSGKFAFISAFIITWLISIGIILYEDQKIHFDKANSIRFDITSDRFHMTTRSQFTKGQESGKLSEIRYLSITSSQVTVQNSSHAWAVTIRASRNYIVNWGLTEEECIWLVNEIQTWLNARKYCKSALLDISLI